MSGPPAAFPSPYPILIGARAFGVDTSSEVIRRDPFRHESIPSQREAVDLTDVPGEGTINVEGLWRRGQNNWHHGGGQLYLDRKTSDDARFLYSQGVDPWTENELTLLPDTVERLAETAYNWETTATLNGYVYLLQSNVNPDSTVWRVQWTTDYVTFHNVATGLASGTGTATAICSNGSYIFLAGSFGVWYTLPGTSTWTQLISDDTIDHIYYVGNRLIVTAGVQVWDISSAKPGVNPLSANGCYLVMQHPDPAWMWLDFTAGESFIYGVGVNNSPAATQVGESIVYQFTVGSENASGIVVGTDLQSGVEALRLEAGEFGGTLLAYQNYVFVGTNLGIRCCRTISQYDPSGNAGDLVSGPLLPNLTQPLQAPFQPYVGNFVSGIVGYNRWVWFSWPSFVGIDGNTYWALGRLDLANFVGELQPAYASDLLVASSSTSSNSHHTLGWDPVTNGPLIVVPQQGFYTQDYNASISGSTKYVSKGYLNSGRITWGIPDMKTLAQANLKTSPVNAVAPFDIAGGGVTMCVQYDQGAFGDLSPLVPNTQANPPVLIDGVLAGTTIGEEINIIVQLAAGSVSHTDDSRPFLNRWTAKALPNVVSGIIISPVIRLFTLSELEAGAYDFSDVYGDYDYLENLRLAQTVFLYKEGNSLSGAVQFEATCVIQQIIWLPNQDRGNADGGFEGDAVVYMKSIVG